MARTHKLSDDDFWLDEPSVMAAGDQEVVDIALLLHELEQQEVKELDHEKRMYLRKQMKEECGHLVQTIMAINSFGQCLLLDTIGFTKTSIY